MQRFRLTELFYVAPQIEVEDIRKIADAGFVKIICNRPDEEVPSYLHSKIMEKAATGVGIDFQILLLTQSTIAEENIVKQFEIITKANGPVLAYCASGMRSTILWALAQVKNKEAEDIICIARSAGYDIEFMRTHLKQQGSASFDKPA